MDGQLAGAMCCLAQVAAVSFWARTADSRVATIRVGESCAVQHSQDRLPFSLRQRLRLSPFGMWDPGLGAPAAG